jgi:hypothetical protein
MRIKKGRLALLALITGFLGIALWEVMYPSPFDPKGPMYQGWKLGVFPLDLDKATETMVGDAYADRLVIGKNQDNLAKKFGFVTTLDTTSGYNRHCYENSNYYRGKPVLFLRKSNWMVVMNNGKAVGLVLIKGC